MNKQRQIFYYIPFYVCPKRGTKRKWIVPSLHNQELVQLVFEYRKTDPRLFFFFLPVDNFMSLFEPNRQHVLGNKISNVPPKLLLIFTLNCFMKIKTMHIRNCLTYTVKHLTCYSHHDARSSKDKHYTLNNDSNPWACMFQHNHSCLLHRELN